MYKLDDFYIDLIVCGKNCEKWIAEIAEKKDIKASLSGYDLAFEKTGIHAKCRNDGSEVCGKTDKYLLRKCIKSNRRKLRIQIFKKKIHSFFLNNETINEIRDHLTDVVREA